MTVGELMYELSRFDSELPIYVPTALGDYDYGKAHTLKSTNLTIEDSTEYPDETLCVVIDEV